MAKSVYRALLEDPDIDRWHKNLVRGSQVTADVYLRRLGNFSDTTGITPKQLTAMNEEQLHNLFLDTITEMEKKYAGSYIKSVTKAIKSWLQHNGIEVKREIKIKGSEDTPTLRDEKVPSQEELKKIFLSADLKGRVASALIAHSGLRIETVGNYLGDDGLRVRDLPELRVVEESIEFEQIPTIVIVRKELSKAGHQYFSFLTEEGCDYVKDYLEMRVRSGEKLGEDSPIVTPKQRMKPFIRSTNVGDVIRDGIRRAGFPWRPYVLRSYFDTEIMLAESKGLVLRDYRQFWMGHKGDIEHRYTLNKGRLPGEVVEDLREAYRRSQEYLQTGRSGSDSEERLRDSFRKQLLAVAGFKPEEVEGMDLSMEDTEFQELVRRRLLGSVSGRGQKVVSVGEVERYLSEGWGFVSTLPNRRAVLTPPDFGRKMNY
jgi:integrase